MNEVLLAETKQACATALESDDLRALKSLLPVDSTLTIANAFWNGLAGRPEALRQLNAVQEESGSKPYSAARCVLVRNALASIDKIPSLPVADTIKDKLCKEYQFFAVAAPEWGEQFDPSGPSYRALTGMSLLERFPAGLLDFEQTGFPRSWLAKVPRQDLLPLLRVLVFEMKGFKPFFFPHNALLRSKIWFMREREWNQAMLAIVRSMAMQPHIKGILSGSWFYCPDTHRVTPHLAFTLKIFRENGGFITNLGPAESGAGFQIGSPERKRLYESGEYKPTETICLWPRDKALAWAAQQPG